MFKIDKEFVDTVVLHQSKLKKPKRDYVLALVSKIDEVNELVNQMESDTIDYTLDEYLDAKGELQELVAELGESTKGMLW